jgi:hypothetical protein
VRFGAEQVGQREPADAEGADLEKIAARNAVAQAVIRAEYGEH